MGYPIVFNPAHIFLGKKVTPAVGGSRPSKSHKQNEYANGNLAKHFSSHQSQ
jgi:hypothetical protein